MTCVNIIPKRSIHQRFSCFFTEKRGIAFFS